MFYSELSAYTYTLLYKVVITFIQTRIVSSLNIFTADEKLHCGGKLHWLTSTAQLLKFVTHPSLLSSYFKNYQGKTILKFKRCEERIIDWFCLESIQRTLDYTQV